MADLAPANEPGPRVLDDAQRRSVLRRCLASALRAGGYSGVAAGEVDTTQPSSERLATSLVVVLFWGVCISAADRLDGPWWSWPLAGLVVLSAFGLVASRWGAVAATVLVVAWLVAGWLEMAHHGVWLVSHAIPAGGLFVLTIATRQIDVRSVRDVAVAAASIPRAAPLIAPLVLVVLVLPSLSADVWEVAYALSVTRIIELAVITVGVLFALVHRQLRAELRQVIVARAKAMVTDPGRVDKTRDSMRAQLRRETFELVSTEADAFIGGAWPSDGAQYAEYIAASSKAKLTSPLFARLGMCVGFVGLAVSVYVYLLLNIVVDRGVVAKWTGESVAVRRFDIGGWSVELAGGSYLLMTGLLTCLAVGTFLAFVLIEERFSVALGDGLLRLPADHVLALALPFLHLTEERIRDGDPLPDDFDVGTFGREESELGQRAVRRRPALGRR